MARSVHYAEDILRVSVPLVGQRTQETHRRGVVTPQIGSLAFFKRPCPRNAGQRERENAARKESCDPLHHIRPPVSGPNSLSHEPSIITGCSAAC